MTIHIFADDFKLTEPWQHERLERIMQEATNKINEYLIPEDSEPATWEVE